MIRKFLFIVFLLFTLNIGYTLADDPGGPGGDPGPTGLPVGYGVPLDNGDIFLLIAGVAFGATILVVKKRKLKKPNNYSAEK